MDDLDATCKHPQQWLIVKTSFSSAVDSKLSNWYTDCTDVGKSDRGNKFLEEVAEVRKLEDVAALPLDDVAKAATDAAKNIEEFKNGMKQWSLPCNVQEHRDKLNTLFTAYDQAMEELNSYAATIEGVQAKMDVTESDLKKKAGRAAKSM